MRDPEIVVVGAGVAGLTASVTAANQGRRTLLVEQLAPGGQVSNVEAIRNFPGFPDGIAGFALGPLLQQQAEAAGVALQLGEVTAIEADGNGYRLTGDEGPIVARAVIVAVGSSLKKLAVPGEAEFAGRGVSHCASCDGPLVKGQPIVVAGGGDSAFDEALVLAQYASQLTLVHRGTDPRARQPVVELLRTLPNVEIIAEAEIIAIHGGTGGVTGVAIKCAQDLVRKPCAGVFAYAGLEPRTGWLRGLLATDSDGRIVVDRMMRTSRAGIFAAGDVRTGSVCLLAEAAGDGATAAVSAARYLSAPTTRSSGGTALADGERSRAASGR